MTKPRPVRSGMVDVTTGCPPSRARSNATRRSTVVRASVPTIASLPADGSTQRMMASASAQTRVRKSGAWARWSVASARHAASGGWPLISQRCAIRTRV